jgi:methionyl-tRNA formyltransferase
MKIVIISIHSWALDYLKDSFDDKQLENVTLITDKLTGELKKYLKLKNIKHLVTKNLRLEILKKLDLNNAVILSAASPWIFNEKLIKKFGKNFYNVHQSPLPSMKGSVAPYIILYDIRSFQVCLHEVTPGIDSGKIVYRKDIFIPSILKTPLEINNFLQSKNREMVKEFLIEFEKKNNLIEETQNKFFSSYNIRLLSDVNGWIDWNYSVDELDRFIRSFGEPYKGAKTFINDKQVNIKFVEKSKQDSARHPDEVGRVIRKFEDYIIVSVNGGSVYIKELLWKNKNIINKIKSGDKFYTKIKYLDLKNRRASFVNTSKRIYNQKTKLIKIQ